MTSALNLPNQQCRIINHVSRTITKLAESKIKTQEIVVTSQSALLAGKQAVLSDLSAHKQQLGGLSAAVSQHHRILTKKMSFGGKSNSTLLERVCTFCVFTKHKTFWLSLANAPSISPCFHSSEYLQSLKMQLATKLTNRSYVQAAGEPALCLAACLPASVPSVDELSTCSGKTSACKAWRYA